VRAIGEIPAVARTKGDAMKLRINVEIDVAGITLLEFAALVDRVKHAIDPSGKRYAVLRLGSGR